MSLSAMKAVCYNAATTTRLYQNFLATSFVLRPMNFLFLSRHDEEVEGVLVEDTLGTQCPSSRTLRYARAHVSKRRSHYRVQRVL